MRMISDIQQTNQGILLSGPIAVAVRGSGRGNDSGSSRSNNNESSHSIGNELGRRVECLMGQQPLLATGPAGSTSDLAIHGKCCLSTIEMFENLHVWLRM